jgi:tRNA pseudouridine32 synthase / 23S rRNA pseudouridine746 synthase
LSDDAAPAEGLGGGRARTMRAAMSMPSPQPLPRIDGLAAVWCDDTAVVVDKPAGLPAVPGRPEALRDCVATRVQAALADALVVHRLDMATSGLLLMARGPDWQRRYSALFADRAMHKRYVAVVQGLLRDDAGEIDLPLIADWPNRPKQKVDLDTGKPSCTRYEVIARDEANGRTRVALMPITGRSHQLRVHLMALGHPIVGDTLYAPPEVVAASSRLLLHAEQLGFVHPVSGDAVRIDSATPF